MNSLSSSGGVLIQLISPANWLRIEGVRAQPGHMSAKSSAKRREAANTESPAQRMSWAVTAGQPSGRIRTTTCDHPIRALESPRAFNAPIGQTSYDSGNAGSGERGPRVRVIGANRVMAANPEKVLKAMVTRAVTT